MLCNNTKVKCPHCGSEVETEIIDVLQEGDPHLTALFNGTLNRPTCPVCGTVFLVERPLVYKETAHPYILVLQEAPEDGETEVLEQDIDNMASDIFNRENQEKPVVRVVFSRPDFLEKISIRRLGFDDRLVEYAKLQLFRSIEEPQLSRSKHRLLLDYSHCNDEMMVFLIFDRETLKAVNAIQVAMSEFKALMEEVKVNDHLLLELETAFPSCYVSADRLL